jgi:hypothetical protein
MKNPEFVFGVELVDGKVYVYDPGHPKDRVLVDQVVIDAVRVWGNKAEGRITAIHGLPQDLAQVLPAKALKALGVGNHLSAANRISGGRRLRAATGASKLEKFFPL